MKKGLQLIFLLIVILQNNSTLALRVDTAYVYTEYHNADSSRIFLVADVIVSARPCNIHNLNIEDSANRTIITICYDGGPATTTCPYRDTFDLGIKENSPIEIIAVFQE